MAVCGEGRHHGGPLARFPHISGPKCPIPSANRCRRRRRLVLARKSKRRSKRRRRTLLSSALDAGRGSRESEYELIWSGSGCCSSACVQCLGLTGACAACSHWSATAWELPGLDHSHAATPERITRASCAQLLRSVLGAACC